LGKKCQKTAGGIFLTHSVHEVMVLADILTLCFHNYFNLICTCVGHSQMQLMLMYSYAYDYCVAVVVNRVTG